ncbi:hypothetical protein I3843_10G120300 [Carya illinoinensis]|nr:hypothetical protein I3843_10G120300 [Carya illinoinensis]
MLLFLPCQCPIQLISFLSADELFFTRTFPLHLYSEQWFWRKLFLKELSQETMEGHGNNLSPNGIQPSGGSNNFSAEKPGEKEGFVNHAWSLLTWLGFYRLNLISS